MARIVFTGVAGGVGDGVQVGDVVVAHDYVQRDMDASPCFRAGTARLRTTRLGCDTALTAMLLEAASAYVQKRCSQFDSNWWQGPAAPTGGSLPVATALSAPAGGAGPAHPRSAAQGTRCWR